MDKSCLAHTSYHQKKVEIVKTERFILNKYSEFQPLKIMILVAEIQNIYSE